MASSDFIAWDDEDLNLDLLLGECANKRMWMSQLAKRQNLIVVIMLHMYVQSVLRNLGQCLVFEAI